MQKQVEVGCLVRAQVPGRRAQVGRVVQMVGDCWELVTTKGRVYYNRCYVERIARDQATTRTRKLGLPIGLSKDFDL